jgi:hypothetical protein
MKAARDMTQKTQNPQNPSSQTGQTGSASSQVDLNALAQEIIKLLKEEIRRENERLGR